MTGFTVRMGVPEMEAYWNDLSSRFDRSELSKTEQKLFKKLVKALGYLRANPRHNSLVTHEIEDLSRRYGMKVWQSYLENQTPAAGRIFWIYGPGTREITVFGIEPHPEDKKRGAYDRIKLSGLPHL